MLSVLYPEDTDYEIMKAEPGDLLQIHRGIYQHWAVYIGKPIYLPLSLIYIFLTGIRWHSGVHFDRFLFLFLQGMKKLYM